MPVASTGVTLKPADCSDTASCGSIAPAMSSSPVFSALARALASGRMRKVSFLTGAGPDAPMNSRRPVVAVEGRQRDLLVGHEPVDLVRPGADRLAGVVGGRRGGLQGRRRVHAADDVGHRVLEAGVRLLEVHLDGVVVDDRGAGVGREHGQRSPRLRRRVDHMVEGGLHGRGVERRPVLELDALAQLQRPCLAIGRWRPLRHEAGVQLALVVVEQRLVDVHADPAVDRQARGARIEVVGRRRDADVQARRRGRVGARARAERRQTARQRHGGGRGAHSGGQLHNLVLL